MKYIITNTFIQLFLVLFVVSSAYSQLTTNNGYLYFKNTNQYLKGNGAEKIEFKSQGTIAKIDFINKENVKVGSIYGSNATNNVNKYFGLLDADGNWSYVTNTDKWTGLKLNNQYKLLLYNNGHVDLPGTRDASGTAGSGVLEIGNSLRLDNNEIITNTNATLFLNYDNNGDLSIDNATLRVDASANNVGIGFTAPKRKLEVKGTVRSTYKNSRNHHIEMGHGGSNSFINTYGAGNLDFRHHGANLMSLHDDGKLIIGSVNIPNDDYRLYVEKGILAEKVRVAVKNSSDWADSVFEENYSLLPVEEVSQFIAKNNHLPNVPSADEVVEKGVDVAEMNSILLRQIEELWLHVIDLKKENSEMKNFINQLLDK